MCQLTKQQRDVVYHPIGSHARVLAVAGAGKTTTMVKRVSYLINERQVSPGDIRILMFNRRARIQFQEKLLDELQDKSLCPDVHTFHSFAYQLISQASDRQLMPQLSDVWIGDREEKSRFAIHRAIQHLERTEAISVGIEAEDALEAIGLWKHYLIPPERAGHRTNPDIESVYKEFERIRLSEGAITFDDFIPIAVGLLQSEPTISEQVIKRTKFVIVDEYQDVNYGQQRLIELIAGDHADVMVVGDDDQTIYEWRGARPDFILSEFVHRFPNKRTIDYQLATTFRLAPLIAQCAQNTIEFNITRNSKPLIAHDVSRRSDIHIIVDSAEQKTDTTKELADQVLALVRETGRPDEVIVLCRLFSQLIPLEVEFVNKGIPYRVLGKAPFFERREIAVLLDYLRFAMRLDEICTQEMIDLLLSIANVPNRQLSRDMLKRSAYSFIQDGLSVREWLDFLLDPIRSPAHKLARNNLQDLCNAIYRIQELSQADSLNAGRILSSLVTWIQYDHHFDDYYGEGESSEDRKRSVGTFIEYANTTNMNIITFLQYVEGLDTTRGVPPDKQIVMTTVFRVKGEEFDYVVLPNCEEGNMPCLIADENPIFDKEHIVSVKSPSSLIDSERRLFYVALTRAREAVYISTSVTPRLGQQANSAVPLPSRFIDELQLSETRQVIDTFHSLKQGDQSTLTQLANIIREKAGLKGIVRNMIDEYLPKQNVTISEKARQRILDAPAAEFEYSIDLRSHHKLQKETPSAVPEVVEWWEQ